MRSMGETSERGTGKTYAPNQQEVSTEEEMNYILQQALRIGAGAIWGQGVGGMEVLNKTGR